MKKVFSLILVVIMIAALASCSKAKTVTPVTPQTTESTVIDSATESVAASDAESSTVVVGTVSKAESKSSAIGKKPPISKSESIVPPVASKETAPAGDAIVWPIKSEKKPENCRLVSKNESDEGILVTVEWKNMDAAKAYAQSLLSNGEEEISSDETGSTYVLHTMNAKISYSATVAADNFVLFY